MGLQLSTLVSYNCCAHSVFKKARPSIFYLVHRTSCTHVVRPSTLYHSCVSASRVFLTRPVVSRRVGPADHEKSNPLARRRLLFLIVEYDASLRVLHQRSASRTNLSPILGVAIIRAGSLIPSRSAARLVKVAGQPTTRTTTFPG